MLVCSSFSLYTSSHFPFPSEKQSIQYALLYALLRTHFGKSPASKFNSFKCSNRRSFPFRHCASVGLTETRFNVVPARDRWLQQGPRRTRAMQPGRRARCGTHYYSLRWCMMVLACDVLACDVLTCELLACDVLACIQTALLSRHVRDPPHPITHSVVSPRPMAPTLHLHVRGAPAVANECRCLTQSGMPHPTTHYRTLRCVATLVAHFILSLGRHPLLAGAHMAHTYTRVMPHDRCRVRSGSGTRR